MVLFDGPPATEGDLLLVASVFFGISLLLACHMFKWTSVVSFVTMCTVALLQGRMAYVTGPYGAANGPGWDWNMVPQQWCVFVLLLMCNVVATLSSVPAVGSLVKRLLDPSLQPWSEGALQERQEEAGLPIPSLTVLLPCYMPNEQGLVEETIEHILTKLRYPRSFTLVVCYNTPHALPIEARLAEMDGAAYDGASGDGTLNTLRIRKVVGSTSKSHNLNAALEDVTTDNVVIYDADHHPDPTSLEVLTSFMLAHGCGCVQGSTYLRREASCLAYLINAEFFITHFVVFPAQQVATDTGLFGGSNALWSARVLKQRQFRHDVQTEDIEYTARALLGKVKIRFCPEARSGELPPASLSALWRQRLRWAIGWDQVTLRHVASIATSTRLHPCRKASLFYILPARWLFLVLSLFSIFAVPLLALINVTVYLPSPFPSWVPDWVQNQWAPTQILEPFLARQAQQLAQYQWICFTTLFTVVLINAGLYEWRRPHRALVVVGFFLLGPLYLIFNLALAATSIYKICRQRDGGWVVTTRADGGSAAPGRPSGAFWPGFGRLKEVIQPDTQPKGRAATGATALH